MNWHSPHNKRRKKRKNTNKINSFRAIEYFLKRCKMVKRKVIHEEKENRVLYIIGNGFDLHHGLKTSYKDFRKYLESTNEDLFYQLGNYYDINETSALWSNFEEKLKDFDPSILEENFGDYTPNWGEDFHDRDWYNLEIYIKKELSSLKDGLQEALNSWIYEITQSSNFDDKKRIKLDSNALYLNFNYTDFLETKYSIPREKITYIHNKIGEGKKLLFGHAWDSLKWGDVYHKIMPEGLSKEEQRLWREEQGEKYDYSIERGYIAINNFFSSIYKDCIANIKNHGNFFSNLKNIQKVYVLGHNIDEVDQPYYKKIIRIIDHKKVDWIISDYNNDFICKKQVLMNLGIPSGKIKPISMVNIIV